MIYIETGLNVSVITTNKKKRLIGYAVADEGGVCDRRLEIMLPCASNMLARFYSTGLLLCTG